MPSIRGQFVFIEEADAANSFFFKAASRSLLANLGVTYGWPLYGVFIAGGENTETPDFILERHSFPTPTGGGDLANKVQTAIDNLLITAYKSPVDAQDRYFFAVCHIWNYKEAKDYLPRGGGVGDYNLYLSQGTPPANWWQNL